MIFRVFGAAISKDQISLRCFFSNSELLTVPLTTLASAMRIACVSVTVACFFNAAWDSAPLSVVADEGTKRPQSAIPSTRELFFPRYDLCDSCVACFLKNSRILSTYNFHREALMVSKLVASLLSILLPAVRQDMAEPRQRPSKLVPDALAICFLRVPRRFPCRC